MCEGRISQKVRRKSIAVTKFTLTEFVDCETRACYIYHFDPESLQRATREALWKCWKWKHGAKTPPRKIRRYLKNKGIYGFFRELLWHLLSEEEYKKLLKLRKQSALHLWKWSARRGVAFFREGVTVDPQTLSDHP